MNINNNVFFSQNFCRMDLDLQEDSCEILEEELLEEGLFEADSVMQDNQEAAACGDISEEEKVEKCVAVLQNFLVEKNGIANSKGRSNNACNQKGYEEESYEILEEEILDEDFAALKKENSEKKVRGSIRFRELTNSLGPYWEGSSESSRSKRKKLN